MMLSQGTSCFLKKDSKTGKTSTKENSTDSMYCIAIHCQHADDHSHKIEQQVHSAGAYSKQSSIFCFATVQRERNIGQKGKCPIK